MNEIIKVEGVSYLYGKGTPFQKLALDNVSIGFEKGKITGVNGVVDINVCLVDFSKYLKKK